MFRPPRISEICSHTPVCVASDLLLTQAMRLMHASKVTGVVVMQGNYPVGILTERDILKAVSSGNSVDQLSVAKVMSSPPVTVPHHLDFFEAYHLCAQKSIRHLIVLDDNGELYGMLTESDFMRILGMDIMPDTHAVSDEMTCEPLLLQPDMPLLEAIRLMMGGNGTAAIAIVDGKPLGILTECDIVRVG